MDGFFEGSELTQRRPLALLPSCDRCGLHRTCHSPKMPVAGKGLRKILVIGEAPGEAEDREGKPFVGPAGQRLRRELAGVGLDLFRDCWVINAARCRPPRNELPDKAVDHCRPLVIRDIERLRPRVILLLGGVALRSVVAELFKDDAGPVARWTGWCIPLRRWNCWLCVAHHPSFVLRLESDNKDRVAVAEFGRHVRAVAGLKKRPYKAVPDDSRAVVLATTAAEAVVWLAGRFGACTSLSFDFETTTLKPDGPHAEIVCCSVSDGVDSVAFPWVGAAVTAMRELLGNPAVAKDGWNVKFEDRWCRKYGIRVRGWRHDGMLVAHALDGRSGTTGLKFQAFVRLGVESYSAGVEPYLKADGGNEPNKIKQVGLHDLLLYNALDSLYEHQICRIQRRELKATA